MKAISIEISFKIKYSNEFQFVYGIAEKKIKFFQIAAIKEKIKEKIKKFKHSKKLRLQ